MDIQFDHAEIARLALIVAKANNAHSLLTHDAVEHLLEETLKVMGQRSGHQSVPSNLVHVVSGALMDSFRVMGPFPIGQSTWEGVIAPGVSYAQEEVDRGGLHDYATRTLAETTMLRQTTLTSLANEMARILS